jgi:hypothetical protein
MFKTSATSTLSDRDLLRLPLVGPASMVELSLPRRDIVMTVERWTSWQVAEYLLSFNVRDFNQNGRPPGFDLLSRRLLIRQHKSGHYPDPSTLPEPQRQPYGLCGSVEFDKALVARVGPCMVGILYCEWLRLERDETFWGYNLSFVDVHESWRGNGIGSSLIRHLNKEPWLQGKNLCLTCYTALGQERLAHVVARELTSTEFALKQPWY